VLQKAQSDVKNEGQTDYRGFRVVDCRAQGWQLRKKISRIEKLSCDGGKKSAGFCTDFATFVTILCILFNLVDIPSEFKSVLRGRGQSIGI
jgi:hypothetical protein